MTLNPIRGEHFYFIYFFLSSPNNICITSANSNFLRDWTLLGWVVIAAAKGVKKFDHVRAALICWFDCTKNDVDNFHLEQVTLSYTPHNARHSEMQLQPYHIISVGAWTYAALWMDRQTERSTIGDLHLFNNLKLESKKFILSWTRCQWTFLIEWYSAIVLALGGPRC